MCPPPASGTCCWPRSGARCGHFGKAAKKLPRDWNRWPAGAASRKVGDAYPLALSSFPYVDYHPAFPYSVFLGQGGAQSNVPQLYWYAMQHAGTRLVGGDGVVAMVDKYQKSGGLFLHYNNARYEGVGGGAMPEGLTPIRDVDFDTLADYDAEHFPARRERFLRCWIGQKGHYGLAQLDRDGRIAGYGVRRICHKGHKTGPLFARDRATAERILDGLVAGIPGEQFYLDIPVPNAAAVALVQDRKMTPVFYTARLYSTRDPVPLPLDEIFGVTTFELG
jgi:hypothetical protein